MGMPRLQEQLRAAFSKSWRLWSVEVPFGCFRDSQQALILRECSASDLLSLLGAWQAP